MAAKYTNKLCVYIASRRTNEGWAKVNLFTSKTFPFRFDDSSALLALSQFAILYTHIRQFSHLFAFIVFFFFCLVVLSSLACGGNMLNLTNGTRKEMWKRIRNTYIGKALQQWFRWWAGAGAGEKSKFQIIYEYQIGSQSQLATQTHTHTENTYPH